MSNKNKTYGNILTITKCCKCGKMLKVPLSINEVRAFEASKEVQLICYNCVKKDKRLI